MNNKRDTLCAMEPLAPKPLTLREFDDLFEDDEELFAWVDRMLGEAQAPAPCHGQQSLSPAEILSTQPVEKRSRTDVKKRTSVAAPPSITERQMRALSRKHLLLMLHDLEKELLQVKRERDNMLTACRAGMARGPQAYQTGCLCAE